MKRSKSLILIISTILIVIGVIAGSIFTNYSSIISSIVTTITAVIGAVALWIQFKKDREINQASFILEFYKTFYQNEDCLKIVAVFDNKFDGFKDDISVKPYRKELQSYINWIKTLCAHILHNNLDIAYVDEMFNYEFFSLTDNKEVQELELKKYPWLYKAIYKTHKIWSEYRKKNGLVNDVYNDESLSLAPQYQQWSN